MALLWLSLIRCRPAWGWLRLGLCALRAEIIIFGHKNELKRSIRLVLMNWGFLCDNLNNRFSGSGPQAVSSVTSEMNVNELWIITNDSLREDCCRLRKFLCSGYSNFVYLLYDNIDKISDSLGRRHIWYILSFFPSLTRVSGCSWNVFKQLSLTEIPRRPSKT